MKTATAQMFMLSKEQKEKLGINKKTPRHNMTDGILKIFYMAERDLGKPVLSVDDIVAAYYNMYTVTKIDKKERNKKAIIMRLFLMKGGTADNGILENVQKGMYRVRVPRAPYYLEKIEEWNKG